jgi:hypothetical protein
MECGGSPPLSPSHRHYVKEQRVDNTSYKGHFTKGVVKVIVSDYRYFLRPEKVQRAA